MGGANTKNIKKLIQFLRCLAQTVSDVRSTCPRIQVSEIELTLKKTTESNCGISYLDISISICNNKYVTEVYDKRDNFNFKIVNYPYMCSNIPAKPTYGVFVSQLIRISRICDNYVSFVKRHRLLTERLIKQAFWYNKLRVSFKKFSRRHSMLFNKYAVSVKRHIREGICIPLDVKPDLVRNITTRNCGCGQCA